LIGTVVINRLFERAREGVSLVKSWFTKITQELPNRKRSN